MEYLFSVSYLSPGSKPGLFFNIEGDGSARPPFAKSWRRE